MMMTPLVKSLKDHGIRDHDLVDMFEKSRRKTSKKGTPVDPVGFFVP